MTILLGPVCLLVTVCIYLGTRRLYRRCPTVLLSPMLVTPALLVALLITLRLPYDTYMLGGRWLANLLGPATVAFAIPLHQRFDLLKKHALAILSGVAAGACVALLTSILLGLWLHLAPVTVRSLAAHSVTTPIAMDLAQAAGGSPTLTAVFVIVTGLWGIIAGPLVIRRLPIRTPVARGTLLGMGAHGLGTSKAFELGANEGTVSSLVMVIAAGFTVMITPLFLSILL